MIIKETGDTLPALICLMDPCAAISSVPEPASFVPAHRVADSCAPAGETGGKVTAVLFQNYSGFTGLNQHHDLPLRRRGRGISFNIPIFLNLFKQTYRKGLFFGAERRTAGHPRGYMCQTQVSGWGWFQKRVLTLSLPLEGSFASRVGDCSRVGDSSLSVSEGVSLKSVLLTELCPILAETAGDSGQFRYKFDV